MTTTQRPARTDADRYASAIETIRRQVALINEALGVTDPREGATFGYLGNLSPRHDDREWMIFLPHPGRIGTDTDRIGGFATDDLVGARQTITAAQDFIRGLRFAATR